MARNNWLSHKSAHEYILKSLKEFPKGATENMLNTKHDPVIVSQTIARLLERGVITLHIDANKVGTARRLYKLPEGK